MSNHLGNVLAVISDKVNLYSHGRIVDDLVVADSVRAEVVSASDYYPFGLAMKGRQFNQKNYRYGFNGQEKVDEISGSGNHISWGNYGMDTRIGRRWQIDPDWQKLSEQSPYSINNNSPISFTDPDGNWAIWTHYKMTWRALEKAGIEKKTAKEIAYYASTYADGPNFLIRGIAKVVGIFNGINPSQFSKNEKKYNNSEMENSQNDETFDVTRHSMKAFFENMPDKEAVDRALNGGAFTDQNEKTTPIEGALNIIENYKGKDLSKLTKAEKKEIGIAIHTIQDAGAHEGGKWATGRDHKKYARDQGDPKRHNLLRDVFGNTSKSKKDTEKAVRTLKGGN